MKTISQFVIRYRLLVLFTTIVIVMFSLFGAMKIKSDVILSDLFPYDHPYLKLHSKFAKIFGTGATSVVIALKVKDGDIYNHSTLSKISEMTREIELWDETYRYLTVSIASLATKVSKIKVRGEIDLEPLMFPKVPDTEEDINKLKCNITSSSSYNGKIVAKDGSAAMIITMFKEDISYQRSFEVLRSLQEKYSDPNTTVHIIGYPMLMGWIYSYKTQMVWVFAFSILLMIGILYSIFRNLIGIVAPMAVGIICTMMGLGFIGFTGINFNPLLYVLAFLVGARMISNSVQITHRFIEEFQISGDKKDAAGRTIQTMWIPNAAAVVTDVAGFSVLYLAKIVLLQMTAIMMSFWMATIILSGLLVPIICSYLPMKKANRDQNKIQENSILTKAITAMSGFSIGRGKVTIGIVVVLLIFVGVSQVSQLKVGDPTPGSPILWPDHPYNQDQIVIDQLFKVSSDNFVLYYEGKEGSVYDPEVLVIFNNFEKYLARALPDLYKSSSSIIDLIKNVHIMFRDGDPMYHQFPRNEDNLLEFIGILDYKAGQVTVSRFMDIPNPAKRAQTTIYFTDHSSENIKRIHAAAKKFFETNSMKTESGEFLLAGGRVGLEIALNDEMKRSHLILDITVLLTIFTMCSLAFRSIVAGLMLATPLILSNIMAFSYMAFAGIGLSTNTLPCAAVGVGVGVDFAIYLYSRCIEEYPRHKAYPKTILAAVRTAGRGIFFTSITLTLPVLAWYFISALKFQAQMGFFLAMLLLINMLLAFTLHPLLIAIIKPKFIRGKS